MDNVQKTNNCINKPSSQTLRSYLHNQYGPGIYPKFRKLERVKIQLARTSIHLTFLTRCKAHDIVPKGITLKAPYHFFGPEIETSSLDWAQLSRLLPEDGDRIQSPKRCFQNKDWTMDNIQKTNNCTSALFINSG
jgi:hypothetical protein